MYVQPKFSDIWSLDNWLSTVYTQKLALFPGCYSAFCNLQYYLHQVGFCCSNGWYRVFQCLFHPLYGSCSHGKTCKKGKTTVNYWVPHAQEAKCQLTAVHILVHAYIWRFTFRLGSQEMNHTHQWQLDSGTSIVMSLMQYSTAAHSQVVSHWLTLQWAPYFCHTSVIQSSQHHLVTCLGKWLSTVL